MKLSYLEKQILKHIYNEYPIEWNRGDEDKPILVGERPLPSVENLIAQFALSDPEMVDRAIGKLIAYQLVAKVRLYKNDEIQTFDLGDGRPQHAPRTNCGAGTIYLQITQRGIKVMGEFWASKFLSLFKKWLAARAGLR